MRLALCALLFLIACGRPLTPNEVAFARALHGAEINPARIRLIDGNPAGAVTFQRPIRPRLTCTERIWPPSQGETVAVSAGATVAFNTILIRRDLYRDDFLAGWPERIDLLDAMLIAHEFTHVWQWQNRARTGYHPLRGAREHAGNPDPYLFDPDTPATFESFGYEQQGAIVEEYLCCHLLDPAAPRTARLRDMIARAMPIDRLQSIVNPEVVRLPWAGAEPEEICR